MALLEPCAAHVQGVAQHLLGHSPQSLGRLHGMQPKKTPVGQCSTCHAGLRRARLLRVPEAALGVTPTMSAPELHRLQPTRLLLKLVGHGPCWPGTLMAPVSPAAQRQACTAGGRRPGGGGTRAPARPAPAATGGGLRLTCLGANRTPLPLGTGRGRVCAATGTRGPQGGLMPTAQRQPAPGRVGAAAADSACCGSCRKQASAWQGVAWAAAVS